MRGVAAALAAHAEVTPKQTLRIFAKCAVTAALATLALDTSRVATVTAEFGDELAVAALERARIEYVGHGGTISPPSSVAQGVSRGSVGPAGSIHTRR